MAHRRVARSSLRCAVLLLAGVAATCQPPPDLDGQPGGAQPLALGGNHPDQLHCRAGDCADWYRLVVAERGDLVVKVTSPVAALSGGRQLVLVLADGRSRQLDRVTASPTQGKAVITWQASPGHYMVRVEARDDQKSPLPYELSAHVVPPPRPKAPPPPAPPPPPPTSTVKGGVIEVEGDIGAPSAVLVDRGQHDGIQPGQPGRLLNGDQVIGKVVVEDSYPEGSRARIDGTLTGPILPDTRVEIDVPAGDRP